MKNEYIKNDTFHHKFNKVDESFEKINKNLLNEDSVDLYYNNNNSENKKSQKEKNAERRKQLAKDNKDYGKEEIDEIMEDEFMERFKTIMSKAGFKQSESNENRFNGYSKGGTLLSLIILPNLKKMAIYKLVSNNSEKKMVIISKTPLKYSEDQEDDELKSSINKYLIKYTNLKLSYTGKAKRPENPSAKSAENSLAKSDENPSAKSAENSSTKSDENPSAKSDENPLLNSGKKPSTNSGKNLSAKSPAKSDKNSSAKSGVKNQPVNVNQVPPSDEAKRVEQDLNKQNN